MKTITSHTQGAAERARAALAERQTSGSRVGAAELRVIAGGTKDAPAAWSGSARVDISDRGRALLAQLAERAPQGWDAEPQSWEVEEPTELVSDTELAHFLAEGIEEGFLA